jgi:hypothetical protein
MTLDAAQKWGPHKATLFVTTYVELVAVLEMLLVAVRRAKHEKIRSSISKATSRMIQGLAMRRGDMLIGEIQRAYCPDPGYLAIELQGELIGMSEQRPHRSRNRITRLISLLWLECKTVRPLSTASDRVAAAHGSEAWAAVAQRCGSSVRRWSGDRRALSS